MRLIKISQQLASIQSNEKEIFIYNDNGLDKVFIDYNEMKIKIKKIITNDKFLLDRHKIASFFIYAIIKNKPILIKENYTDILNDDLEFIANSNLAVIFANYIIKTFYEAKNNKTIKIITPKSDTTNYNDQLFSLIKLLKNRIENENDEEILLISLSHILFLIEKYSECKIENSKKENKK
jgi:hypothetical protein